MINDRIDEITNIIDGITYRCRYKVPFMDIDDIKQELWLTILKRESKLGEMDDNLIAYICYDKIVDLCRYEIRRINYTEVTETIKSISYDFDDKVTLKLLLEMYPEDSDEGMLLRYWCGLANLIESYHDTETQLARELGYSDTGHRAYKRLKAKMKDIMKEYFK